MGGASGRDARLTCHFGILRLMTRRGWLVCRGAPTEARVWCGPGSRQDREGGKWPSESTSQTPGAPPKRDALRWPRRLERSDRNVHPNEMLVRGSYEAMARGDGRALGLIAEARFLYENPDAYDSWWS